MSAARVGLSSVSVTAYDWRACARAVARVWPHVDESVVSWDHSGRTWGGGDFEPPDVPGFARFWRSCPGVTGLRPGVLAGLRFLVGDFYVPGVGRLALQSAQRRAAATIADPRNRILVLDSDDEPCNLPEFIEWVGGRQRGRAVYDAACVSVYKVLAATALVLGPARWVPTVFDRAEFVTGARSSTRPGHRSPLRFVNWFLAEDGEDRDPEHVRLKLDALSYGGDLGDAFMEQWLATTLDNYRAVTRVGNVFRRCELVPVGLDDLRAGRWGRLLP